MKTIEKYASQMIVFFLIGECAIKEYNRWIIPKADLRELVQELRQIGIGTHIEFYPYGQKYVLATRQKEVIKRGKYQKILQHLRQLQG